MSGPRSMPQMARAWTDEQNAARSEKLSGRTLPLEQRAAMHASHTTGRNPDTPEWQEAYQDRMRQLRLQELLLERARAGRLPTSPPEGLSGITQAAKVLNGATEVQVTVDHSRLAEQLEERVLNWEALETLAEWAGIRSY